MKMLPSRFLLAGLLVVAFPVLAQNSAAESAAVSKTVDAFHGAIQSGNATAAAALLADDSIFLEGGGIETRAEYVMNHLPEDIKFEKVIKSKYKSYRVTVQGDSAWAVSNSEMVGTYEGSRVDMAGVELMVLSKQGGAWKIRSISWSSRRR